MHGTIDEEMQIKAAMRHCCRCPIITKSLRYGNLCINESKQKSVQ